MDLHILRSALLKFDGMFESDNKERLQQLVSLEMSIYYQKFICTSAIHIIFILEFFFVSIFVDWTFTTNFNFLQLYKYDNSVKFYSLLYSENIWLYLRAIYHNWRPRYYIHHKFIPCIKPVQLNAIVELEADISNCTKQNCCSSDQLLVADFFQ